MPTEPVTVYRSGSQLREPRHFLEQVRNEFAASRGVAWRLFLRDLRSRHRRSLLGYAWIVVPPLVTAVVWVFLDSSGIIRAGDTDVPYGVFVVTGTTLWQSFLDGLNAPFDKLAASQQLITKFKLPPEAFILIGLADVVFNAVIRFSLLGVLCVVTGVAISTTAVLVPFGVLLLIAFGTALGALLAPFGTLFPDVQRSLGLVTMAWFFLTPIVYSPDQVGGLQRFNPVAVLLVTTRDWLFTGDTRWPISLAVVAVLTVLALPVTFVLARVAVPHLVDRAAV